MTDSQPRKVIPPLPPLGDVPAHSSLRRDRTPDYAKRHSVTANARAQINNWAAFGIVLSIAGGIVIGASWPTPGYDETTGSGVGSPSG